MIDFFVVFSLIFLSEVVDKTQLVILGLALRFRPLPVFLGALSAHALMDGLAVLFGAFFGSLVDFSLLRYFVGVSFILIGVRLFFKKHTSERKRGVSSAFAGSFGLVLLSEFGDKTQVASGLLATQFSPLLVFFGAVLALAFAIGLNVFVGRKFASRLPVRFINLLSVCLFVIFGFFLLT